RVDTPPHQEVTIPPAPTTECDPELVEIFYKHFERKAAGIDVNVSVQERKDFQNPSSYEQLILNFGIDEVAEDQRKHMDSINAAKKVASGGSSSAASIKKKA
ncbi:HCNGP-like protein, partial [Ancylostoma duodenale]